MGCPAHPPADDAAGIGVDDKGDIDEAGPSGHVGKVRDPQPIRCRSVELAIDLVERARRGLAADCRADRLAADHPLQAHLPHQPPNSAASDIEAFPLQLPPRLAHAVDTEVLFEDASAGAWCGDSFSSATATVAGRAGRPDGSKLTILYQSGTAAIGGPLGAFNRYAGLFIFQSRGASGRRQTLSATHGRLI